MSDHRDRRGLVTDRRTRGQAGVALTFVLVLVAVGITITLAALAFAMASTRAGTVYVKRDLARSRERDALDYLVQVIRPDLTKGVQGNVQTATVAGVTVTCTGESGSGQTAGKGRTDRTITCTTPSITARYRIFDRSGDRPGIIVETLWETVSR